MSHSKERKEKNCLNCGTTVVGRYCHVCGQENIDTKESFWSLVKHFVFDILHFDGKFWLTIKRLFANPGRVARDYVEGRRATYVHPIRLYLFTSAIFFIVFFSKDAVKINSTPRDPVPDMKDRRAYAKMYESRMRLFPADSFLRGRVVVLLDSTRRLNMDSTGWEQKGQRLAGFDTSYYRSVAEYDSLQTARPEPERDGLFRRAVARKVIALESEYETQSEGLKTVIGLFLHRMPYLLFISLPFFAGILKLLYWRRRQFAYSDHAVFTLYHYVLTFITLLFTFLVDSVMEATHWEWLGYLIGIAILAWCGYLFFQMRRFYGRGRTVGKFVLLNLLATLLLAALFALFLILSIFI